ADRAGRGYWRRAPHRGRPAPRAPRHAARLPPPRHRLRPRRDGAAHRGAGRAGPPRGRDLGGAIPKIEDAPWAGYPADPPSIAVVGATQSEGTVLIFEKMFESRLFFVDRLASMGARLILCDPHRVVVSGRSALVGQELVSPDIRAGMALLIAALCADGTSV